MAGQRDRRQQAELGQRQLSFFFQLRAELQEPLDLAAAGHLDPIANLKQYQLEWPKKTLIF